MSDDTPRPTRHGATQTEDERVAKQVKLRLRPRDRRRLDALARRWGVTRSEAVIRLVDADPEGK